MANSQITKRVLAKSLKELVQKIPLEKITIADICASSGMNRKSFYYHFRDKYDLLRYIFQSEFMMQQPQEITNKKEIYYKLCQYLYENKEFYRHVFRPHQHNYFLLYFQEVIQKYAEDSVADLMIEYHNNNDFYIHFLTAGITDAIQRWITDHTPVPPEEVVSKTSLLVEKIGLQISQER